MYGSFSNDKSVEKEKNRQDTLKANRIKLLKDIHMNKKGIKSKYKSTFFCFLLQT